MISIFRYFSIFILVLVLSSCVSSEFTEGSIDQRREAIIELREVALQELFTTTPSLEINAINAVGYAVFSDAIALAGLINVGNGVGIVRDNSTGNEIFMIRKNRGVGVGLGKSTRDTLIIFNSESALAEFISNGSLDISERTGEVSIYSHNIEGLMFGLALNMYEHHLDSELN